MLEVFVGLLTFRDIDGSCAKKTRDSERQEDTSKKEGKMPTLVTRMRQFSPKRKKLTLVTGMRQCTPNRKIQRCQEPCAKCSYKHYAPGARYKDTSKMRVSSRFCAHTVTSPTTKKDSSKQRETSNLYAEAMHDIIASTQIEHTLTSTQTEHTPSSRQAEHIPASTQIEHTLTSIQI